MSAITENLFAYILFFGSIVTGIAWFYDFKVDRPIRKQKYEQEQKIQSKLSKKELKALLEPKGFIGQLGSLFFVILFVFLFRSFVFEPFRIPSGSMMPTLVDGDFIAVDKWSFGIRNPLTNNVMIDVSKPKRGDIIVFKYPEDKSIDFIKRVVALPGDTVIYQDKHLYLIKAGAGDDAYPELISTRLVGNVEEEVMGFTETFNVYEETFGDGETHQIRVNPNVRSFQEYFYHQTGKPDGMWTVPDNCYFAMGDNRDNSKDSRFWGFVPFENIVGKTRAIWLSFEFNRDANSSIPKWIPSAFRFDRIGGVH
ncbi:MAG: signal peptidase I [Succinatimonas sp.]|nr:signal peptidase I [Succinatimonas sp.]